MFDQIITNNTESVKIPRFYLQCEQWEVYRRGRGGGGVSIYSNPNFVYSRHDSAQYKDQEQHQW